MQQTTSACREPVTNPGQTVPRNHGAYRLDLSLPVDGGYAINTYPKTGVGRIDALSFVVADVDTANLIYRVIAEGGERGVSPDGVRDAIRDRLTRDLHNVQSRRDTPSRNRIWHINQMLDRLQTDAERAAVAELVDTVTAFLTGNTPPRNITDTVPAGTRRQMPPTLAGAHLTNLSDPALRVLRAAHTNGGTITRSRNATVTQLQSLARKGYVTLNYQSGTGRRRVVESATLTAAGTKAAAR